MNNNFNREDFIKKLLYRSKTRGCRETALILTEFAEQYLSNMPYKDLLDFSLILDQTDTDLYEWITRQTSVPLCLNRKLINKL